MQTTKTRDGAELWDFAPERPVFEERVSKALRIDAGRGHWRDRFGVALRRRLESRGVRRPAVLSLFSGAGGLDIGFHDAGFEIVQMVEIEADFVATLRANIGKARYFRSGEPQCIDIRDYSAPFSGIDFVIGGPPCQTFSAAGRRASGVEGTQEARGMLFAEYARLLAALRPKGFLFENVYGMTGAENGDSMRKVVDAFEAIGYRLQWRVLDAADYGVPQHRERLIIVGLAEGAYRFPSPTHGPDSPEAAPFCSALEALEGCAFADSEPLDVNGRHGHLLKEIPPGLNYSFFTEKLGHPNPIFAWRSKFSDYLYKADPGEPVRTIKAQGGQYTGPFHWDGRRFSVAEIKRLQSFPDDYLFYGGRQRVIQQIGNSVPPQLARILACSIAEQVFGEELPFDLPTLSPCAKLGFRQRKRLRTAEYQAIAQDRIRRLRVKPVPVAGRGKPETLKVFAEPATGFTFDFFDARPNPSASFRLTAKIAEREWSFAVLGNPEDNAPASWSVRGKIREAGAGGAFTPSISPVISSLWASGAAYGATSSV